MGSGQMGETHSPIENMFKFNRIQRGDFRWGHPFRFARPCWDSGQRTNVAIASPVVLSKIHSIYSEFT